MRCLVRRLPPLNALKAFEAACPPRELHAGGRRAVCHPGRGEPPSQSVGGGAGRQALQSRAPAPRDHRGWPPVSYHPPRGLMTASRWAPSGCSSARVPARLRSARHRTLPPSGWSTVSAVLPRSIPASTCARRRHYITSISRVRMSTLPCATATATGF